MDDTQTGHLGCLQDNGTGALDVAAGAYADDEFPTPYTGHRHFHFRGPRVAVRRDSTAAAQGQTYRPGDDLDPPWVRFAQPLSGPIDLSDGVDASHCATSL